MISIFGSGCNTSEKKQVVPSKDLNSFSIKGISLVASVKEVNSEAFDPVINVNANSVAIMPYAFCSVANPKVKFNMDGQWWGESYRGAGETIRLSHEKMLSVMVKPHLWLSHGDYTGALNFSSDSLWNIWEKSYSEYVLQFATLSDSLKVDIFCLGTELGSVVKNRPAFFPQLIRSVRNIYHGKITYAANWDDYAVFPYWSQLDFIGIDAYFPIDNSVTPSVKDITKGWTKYLPALEKLSIETSKKIIFTEYGYRNVDKPADEPWKEYDGIRNDLAQSNALEGFFEVFQHKSWFAGGYLWKWYIDTGRHHRQDIDFTPQGKVGEDVVRKWYRGLAD